MWTLFLSKPSIMHSRRVFLTGKFLLNPLGEVRTQSLIGLSTNKILSSLSTPFWDFYPDHSSEWEQ